MALEQGMRKMNLWTFRAEAAEEKIRVKVNRQMRSVGHIPPKFTKKDAG